VAHHLRLEAIGQDVVDVVIHKIASDGGDAVLCLQNVATGAIFLLDGRQFLVRTFLEQIL
jgi:hypothetical protein